MFKGMVEHQLDDKNRLRIPSRFKKELTGENGERSYSFFRGMNHCICVMADDELDDTLSSISEESISEAKPRIGNAFRQYRPGRRRFARQSSAAFHVEEDGGNPKRHYHDWPW